MRLGTEVQASSSSAHVQILILPLTNQVTLNKQLFPEPQYPQKGNNGHTSL